MFDLMLKPFVECLILVGIHSYLGLHVIRRRVIFVDLALAQIAALGTIVGGMFGLMDGTTSAMLFSLTFCLGGAALFAGTRVRHDRIPHEAVIGLVYIVAFATAVLIVQKSEGVEHMEGILVGSLLFVTWTDIIAAAVVYSLIGLFHLFFWRKFLLISEYPEKAFRQGINIRLWDFLFYASFGFVITFSTRVAGVLLVFVFLVAPAIMAFLVSSKFGKQLAVGWGAGTLVVTVGLYLSVAMDLSPGPTIVAFYAVCLVVMAVIVYILRASQRGPALIRVASCLAFMAVLVGMVYLEGRFLGSLVEHETAEAVSHQQNLASATALKQAEQKKEIKEKMTVLTSSVPVCVGRGKIERYASLGDSLARLEFIQEKVRRSRSMVLGFLYLFLSDPETTGFYRGEAVQVLAQVAGTDYGYLPEQAPAANLKALSRLCQQIKQTQQM